MAKTNDAFLTLGESAVNSPGTSCCLPLAPDLGLAVDGACGFEPIGGDDWDDDGDLDEEEDEDYDDEDDEDLLEDEEEEEEDEDDGLEEDLSA